MTTKKLLLHACCAPCGGYVYTLLKKEYNTAFYFYNPNIAPEEEYTRRFDELDGFSKLSGVLLLEGNYDVDRWTSLVEPYKDLGERSERCRECYMIRLEETFRKAGSEGFDAVATVLSVSPHKDADIINDLGMPLADKYNIEYLPRNFKKQDGFKKAALFSKEHNFYRQNYCGCVYSMMERQKTSAKS